MQAKLSISERFVITQLQYRDALCRCIDTATREIYAHYLIGSDLREEAMRRDDEIAVAEFLKDGGRIVKVEPDVPATVTECLAYLESCGVSAKYFPGDPKPYLCHKRRLSLQGLFELANGYRRGEHLQPFAIKHD